MIFLGSDMYDVIFEQYVGTALVGRQTARMPSVFIIQNFTDAIHQTAASNQPCKVKILRYEDIWDKIEQKMKQVEYSIEFKNWED